MIKIANRQFVLLFTKVINKPWMKKKRLKNTCIKKKNMDNSNKKSEEKNKKYKHKLVRIKKKT